MRRLAPLALTLLVLLGAPAASSAQPGSPLDLLLDVCVLPADDCADLHAVMTATIDGETKRMAILRTEILRGPSRTGSVQTELTLRPMKMVGPKELLQELTAGSRLRIRAQTRLASRMMMLQSVVPSKR